GSRKSRSCNRRAVGPTCSSPEASTAASVKAMASWPNRSELIVPADADARVGLVGAPLAAGSVTPGHCDEAPALLRTTLRRIGRYDVETRRELSTLVADRGDTNIEGLSIEEATTPLRGAVRSSVDLHELT